MLNLCIFSSSPLKVYVFFFCTALILPQWLHLQRPPCKAPSLLTAQLFGCSHFFIYDGDKGACRHEAKQLAVWFQLTQPGAKCWENSKVKDRLPEEPAASPHCFPSSFTCFFFKGLRFYVLHPDRNSDTTITVSI